MATSEKEREPMNPQARIEYKFSKKFKPEIRLDCSLPESVTIENRIDPLSLGNIIKFVINENEKKR